MMRPLLVAGMLLLMTACTAVPQRASAPATEMLLQQEAREALLSDRDHWRLSGRIAVSDGGDGGSGRIDWLQDGERYEITLSAPVTRRSWRLLAEPGFALLEGIEGGPYQDVDAGRLLAERAQWHVPLADLVAWMKGIRGEGPADIEFQPSGLPASIRQRGWHIEYRSYDNSHDPAMPQRVFATRDEQRIRIQIAGWEFFEPSE